MTLQERLDAMKAQFQAKAPKEALELMHRATEDLRKSGILGRGPKVGDKAPEFTLPSAMDQPVSLTSLLAEGPLVLGFYRGKW